MYKMRLKDQEGTDYNIFDRREISLGTVQFIWGSWFVQLSGYATERFDRFSDVVRYVLSL